MESTAVPKPEVAGTPGLQPKNKKAYYLYEVEIPAGEKLEVKTI
ncbi:hypothetical protein [Gaoshiqia sediminis]|uniref:Uncharacterized protein n=1 Tax=Gaoshiqia sediminis TaxID=2986998 RepID=A0AA41Y4D9_9BACT|nr:hypothetical protein [Gaoshiqia sediminis]MCW0481620.1 hypothetical protein [Gaoshiqia sediminis]